MYWLVVLFRSIQFSLLSPPPPLIHENAYQSIPRVKKVFTKREKTKLHASKYDCILAELESNFFFLTKIVVSGLVVQHCSSLLL